MTSWFCLSGRFVPSTLNKPTSIEINLNPATIRRERSKISKPTKAAYWMSGILANQVFCERFFLTIWADLFSTKQPLFLIGSGWVSNVSRVWWSVTKNGAWILTPNSLMSLSNFINNDLKGLLCWPAFEPSINCPHVGNHIIFIDLFMYVMYFFFIIYTSIRRLL